MTQGNLCSTEELRKNLGAENLVIIDASWYLPSAQRDAYQEFTQQRIVGAVFFDIEQISDVSSSLPHMLPSEQSFSQAVNALGIENSSELIIYDSAGLFSAARVWWMFKYFGHQNVRILNGGLPAWVESGGEVHTTLPVPPQPAKSAYSTTVSDAFLADKNVLMQNSESAEYLVLDARSEGRFRGEQPEPRADLTSGHMPYSMSLPYDRLLSGGYLKSVSQLQEIFAQYGVQPSQTHKPLITSCGSGVTAAIITLALSEAGFAMHKLYDGAWAEWASATDTTILQGG